MLAVIWDVGIPWSHPTELVDIPFFLLNKFVSRMGNVFLMHRSRTVRRSLLMSLRFLHRRKVTVGEAFTFCIALRPKVERTLSLKRIEQSTLTLLTVLTCRRCGECRHCSAAGRNCRWMCHSYLSAFSPPGEKPFSSQLLAMHQVMKCR